MEGTTALFTIGYQGKIVETLIDELVAANVELLVDIRRRPMSRKPGFAKKSLSARLETAGVGYFHIPDLGMPLDLFGMRNAKDNTGILQEYERRIQDLEPYLNELAELAGMHRSCILCFEADHTQCHRDVVAKYLEQHNGLTIVHL